MPTHRREVDPRAAVTDRVRSVTLDPDQWSTFAVEMDQVAVRGNPDAIWQPAPAPSLNVAPFGMRHSSLDRRELRVYARANGREIAQGVTGIADVWETAEGDIGLGTAAQQNL